MSIREFALPDLGEGLTEGEILQWLVEPGETVRLNQPIIEVETAKAAVEIPSPYAGVVTELVFPAGTTVDVGSVIIRFETDPGGPPAADDLVPAKATRPPAEPAGPAGAAPAREAVLVGYGVRQGTAVRRARRPVTTEVLVPSRVSAAEVAHAAEASLAPSAGEAVPVLTVMPTPDVSPPRVHVLAKPPVRKLAKDLGVDLATVSATGPGGTVTRADVLAAAAPSGPAPATAAAGTAAAAAPVTPAAGREGYRIPVKGVRRSMAQAMVSSAFTAPQATLFATVDMTPSVELITRLRKLPAFEGGSVGPLLLVARALLLAARRHPEINASWDEAAQEIVVHGGVGLGIAAATPRGLLVPVLPDADLLTLPELSRALSALTATARAGRTTPAELAGGTITITNVGAFGMDNGTPILNPGEAVILCLGAVRPEPWVHEGAVAIRHITRLSITLDHRLIDGALGAAFLADIAAVLAEPALLLAWG